MVKRNVDVKYRLIRADELPVLLDLYKYLHVTDAPLPEDGRLQEIWNDFLTDRKVNCLVAEVDNCLVATCVLTIIPNLTRGAKPYGLIENVVTHAEYREKGIGTGLLKYAQKIAWDRGCYKVMLMTGRQQPEIFRFYENAGLRRGEKIGFIVRPRETK